MDKILFLRTADRKRSKRRAQYRYKTTEHVQNRKHKRDEDGFFIPVAMFRPYNGSGLLCEVLGTTPARRMADLRVQQDYLMLEAYEHEIEMLMCQMRLHEYAFHRRFCTEDRAEERYARRTDGIANAGEEAPEMTASDTRQVILNAVTWRYDWIQRYKKPCFQFAEAVIDCKVLPEEKRNVALMCRGVSLEEQEKFMVEFIREAATMPEPNRELVDFMYETAWRVLFEYLLILYVCYWLINRFICKHEIKTVCWVLIATLTLIFGSDLEREQAVSFALGILMSEKKEKVVECLEKRNNMIIATGLSCAISFGLLFLKHTAYIRSLFGTVPYALIQIGIKVPLAIGIMMLICVVSYFFNSAPFKLLGKISFELYLVHLVLIRFFNVLTVTSSMLINIAIAVWGSIFMAYVYNMFCSKVKNIIEGKI